MERRSHFNANFGPARSGTQAETQMLFAGLIAAFFAVCWLAAILPAGALQAAIGVASLDQLAVVAVSRSQ